ncbi:hypothetical protein [Burkholderia sp. BCC0044]|uniref:hypothetical protein n=1 Tax=Burkholderia sp. BCC0044 TaxID=2676295 RepID=UPI00158BEC11|nr:hypothetical protein [Burkholderia sp. BCC0044]
MNAGAASADAGAAGSAAAFATADCAERCVGTGPGSVDDAKGGVSAGVPDSVCAPAAQAKPADTMQTNDESEEEKFMTNRTE